MPSDKNLKEKNWSLVGMKNEVKAELDEILFPREAYGRGILRLIKFYKQHHFKRVIDEEVAKVQEQIITETPTAVNETPNI